MSIRELEQRALDAGGSLVAAVGRDLHRAYDRCTQLWRGQPRDIVAQIEALEPTLEGESDGELHRRSLALRYRAKTGEPLSQLTVEAYALVREAARRTIGLRHFPEQILGALALSQRSIVEMQTGEGKTLTATMPLYLHALAGKGVHLATANDYLARRDAEQMGPVYRFLGLSAGVVEGTVTARDVRQRAYDADITYGTLKEFGFDALRDRLWQRHLRENRRQGFFAFDTEERRMVRPVQRERHFLLVDEADNLLIDDACTPLIISASSELATVEAAQYKFCAAAVGQFEVDNDFEIDRHRHLVELTPRGRQRLRSLPRPELLNSLSWTSLYDDMERALTAQQLYLRGRDYVVRDDKVEIVDASTGRIAEGRKWRRALHQAIEAKEHVPITAPTDQAARITLQDLALGYTHLAGMSGTVMTSSAEFRRIFSTRAVAIPTHLPCLRQRCEAQLLGTAEEKWNAIVGEAAELSQSGRAVLIGTRSIEKSEHLSELLTSAGLPHVVLNAKQIAREAEIVAQAGQPGRITVATNMAGRGTDIVLADEVRERGGLHVICSELNDAERIDLQLIGRCARQGDPGTYRQYLSLDDDVLERAFGTTVVKQLKADYKPSRARSLIGRCQRAQRMIERRNLLIRRRLLWQERETSKARQRMGFDPHLDVSE
ncbi:MAG: preprotein translocase subunit SecA [Planctomycetes bacterium]|nr:preprotein translocase subunit SecA [Planctomycetota bacterium]